MSDLFHENIPAEFLGRVFDVMEQVDRHVYQVLTKRSSLMRNFVNRRYADRLPPAHIWLGVSIENASTLGRLRHLKQTSATVRFVSFEPLLGPVGTVDLTGIHWVIAGGESGPGARPVEIEWLREIRDRCRAARVAFFFKQWGGRSPKSGGNELDGRQWQEYPTHTPDFSEIGSGRRKGPSWTEGRLQAPGTPPEDDGDTMDVGPWAKEKLACLEKYLHAYTTIMRRQTFKGYFYVDAFAGPGSLKVRKQENDPAQQSLLEVAASGAEDEDEEQYIAGSPRVALEIEHPFTDYFFIEKDDSRIKTLHKLKREHKTRGNRIRIHTGDCNNRLGELLRHHHDQWKHWRGVVFLDPFGMQVPWKTIADLGATRSIEVFLNFPVGMAIQRLLKRSRSFTDKERSKLDAYFGTGKWFDLLYRKQEGLFGEAVVKDTDAGDRLVRWYRKRLKAAFGYASSAREIRSRAGRPLYYLIFAGPNETGEKIASYVLKQGARQVK